MQHIFDHIELLIGVVISDSFLMANLYSPGGIIQTDIESLKSAIQVRLLGLFAKNGEIQEALLNQIDYIL